VAGIKRYQDWAMTVFCWDGMLPITIAAMTSLLVFLFPRNDVAASLFAVFAPIVGFFLRLWIGGRYFDAHPHYAWQVSVFFIAVLWLIFLDCLLIVFRQMPNEMSIEDWCVFALFYLPYLGLMAIALFPMRGDVAEEVQDEHFRLNPFDPETN
jgi:hypothetical protein